MKGARILVADDEKGMRDFLGILLRKAGYDVALAASGGEALALTAKASYDLLVSDIRMPDLSGIDLLREVKATSPQTLVVLLTAYASTQTAVAALKLGAYDYITKPFDVEEFKIVVAKALERKHLQEENVSLRQQLQSRRGFDSVIGTSTAIRELLELVNRVADTPATILLTGERGTGKEVLARAIHEVSRRREHKFVSVNCAAIQESLLESELFGHVRGAFTGAISAHPGLFETADGGTILLDEVGEMSATMQAKLLRVLQERTVRRVGGNEETRVDVRVLASTNRDLTVSVADSSFRADLYDRLNVISIRLPPLRDRMVDIPLLAEHFLRRAARQMERPVAGIEAEAMRSLEAYGWPGNVRELENAIERAVAIESGTVIRQVSLPDTVRGALVTAPERLLTTGAKFDLEAYLDELRKRYIAEALESSSGKMVEACKRLGISFRAIRYYAKKYQLR